MHGILHRETHGIDGPGGVLDLDPSAKATSGKHVWRGNALNFVEYAVQSSDLNGAIDALYTRHSKAKTAVTQTQAITSASSSDRPLFPQSTIAIHHTSEAMQTGKPSIGASAESSQASNMDEALAYLEKIQTRYATQPEIYEAFLDIMKDLKKGAISPPDAVAHVNMLFEDDAELTKDFQQFAMQQSGPFPDITSSAGTRKTPSLDQVTESNMNDAFAYLDKVKAHCATNPKTHDSFLLIMRDLHKGTIDQADATLLVNKLFEGDAEIRKGFETFVS
ncbi:hypothetical protein E4T42_07451 [Aureobasidium subglaciale]|nr:hypothetical protein E4T42_07451 [Aureobasidium subglaciale]